MEATFVVPVNDDELFLTNFLASPLFEGEHGHEILAQRGFSSAGAAYNDAIRKASHDVLIFCHQDIVLPARWLAGLERSLEWLRHNDPNWGVLGCCGVTGSGEMRGFLYCTGNGRFIGRPFEAPMPVQTLDEVVLVTRRSSGLSFDDSLPGFHFYGADICMAAARANRQCYGISDFCLHNSNQTILFPKEFLDCYDHVRRRWADALPVHTPCVKIIPSAFASTMIYKHLRRLEYISYTFLGRKPNKRSAHPLTLLRELEAMVEACSDTERGEGHGRG